MNNTPSQNIINIILDAGRGECSAASREATTGERYGLLPSAHRAGYTFEGWYTAPGAAGERVSAGDLVTSEDDITLYAHYAKKKAEAKKKKKSTYRTQKKILFIGLASIVVLVAVLIGVNYLVSIIPYTDYDGQVYKAKKSNGIYAVYDSEGNRLPQNEDGYYLTEIGTQLKLNETTGAIKQYAYVYTEGMEEPGAGQRILMFAQIRQSDVISIEVTNSNGNHFRIYNRDITNTSTFDIVVEGYESGKYMVQYDKEMWPYLCVAAGYPLSIQKLPNDKVAELGYAEYGLVPETRTDAEGKEYEYTPTTYTIVGAVKDAAGKLVMDENGKPKTVSHTVIVGDAIVSSGGYYVKLAGDENKSVYIMNNDNYDEALLQPIEKLVTPVLTYPVSLMGASNVENFYLASCMNGDRTNLSIDVAFDYVDLTMRSNTVYSVDPYRTGSGYRYQYGGYRLNGDRLSTILQSLYSPTIERICKLGLHDEKDRLDPTLLAPFGLDKPYKVISYDMQLDEDNDAKFDGFAHNYLLISEETENGTYYVYSDLSDMVAEVAKESLYYVEFSNFDWINPLVIYQNIAYIRSIDISSSRYSASIVLDNSASSQKDEVNSKNLQFTINGIQPDYIVMKPAPVTGRLSEETPVYNLRQFYKVLLHLNAVGDARVSDQFPLPDEKMAELRALPDDDPRVQLVMKIEVEDYAKITNPNFYPQNNKSTYEFRFYRYSEGRSYMTINGEGEFYVDASFVEKIINDAIRLEDGSKLIDASAKD